MYGRELMRALVADVHEDAKYKEMISHQVTDYNMKQ